MLYFGLPTTLTRIVGSLLLPFSSQSLSFDLPAHPASAVAIWTKVGGFFGERVSIAALIKSGLPVSLFSWGNKKMFLGRKCLEMVRINTHRISTFMMDMILGWDHTISKCVGNSVNQNGTVPDGSEDPVLTSLTVLSKRSLPLPTWTQLFDEGRTTFVNLILKPAYLCF